MGYTVNEMIKPQTDWLTHVADVKRVGYGEKAAFRTKLEGVTAFIQAKGATPARSKIAHQAGHAGYHRRIRPAGDQRL